MPTREGKGLPRLSREAFRVPRAPPVPRAEAAPLTASAAVPTLGRMDDETAELRSRLARLEAEVADLRLLRTAVEELADRVLDDREPDGAAAVNPRAWAELGAEQARAALEELRLWMAAVLVHHPRVVGMLRPCWYRHPAAVQLLLDARTAWLAAYRGADGGGAATRALDWSRCDLPHLEEGLAREMSRCTGAAHELRTLPLPELDAADLDRYLDGERGAGTP